MCREEKDRSDERESDRGVWIARLPGSERGKALWARRGVGETTQMDFLRGGTLCGRRREGSPWMRRKPSGPCDSVPGAASRHPQVRAWSATSSRRTTSPLGGPGNSRPILTHLGKHAPSPFACQPGQPWRDAGRSSCSERARPHLSLGSSKLTSPGPNRWGSNLPPAPRVAPGATNGWGRR